MRKFYCILIAMLAVNGAMAQWVLQNSGTTKNLNSVYFTDENIGYAVGDSGTILKTPDGGANWSVLNSGSDADFLCVFFTEAHTGYTVGNDSIIYKTIDGGQNWIKLSAGISVNLNSVYFTGIDTGYVTGNSYGPDMLKNYILKTTNGGDSWTISHYGIGPDGGGPFLKSIHFPEVNTGYVVGEQSQLPYPFVLKTTNGGASWITQNAGYDHFLSRSVYFINPEVGYLVNPLLKTTNGGEDWTMLNPGISVFLNAVHFTDADNGYAAGQNNNNPPWGSIILKTSDGGINWTTQYFGTVTYSQLNSVYFVDDSIGYSVGSGGTILQTTNGGYVGINGKQQTNNTLTVYPNPASINITLETLTKGSLSILNLQGKQLITRQITEPRTQLDISSLPCGVYFVQLRDDRTVRTGKFIKQ